MSERAMKIFRSVKVPHLEGRGRVFASVLARRAGRIDEAMDEARQAMELLKSYPVVRIDAEIEMGRAFLAAGRAPEALLWLEGALAELQKVENPGPSEFMLRSALIEAHRAVGDVGTARSEAERAYARLMAEAKLIRRDDWRSTYLSNVEHNAQILEAAAELGVIDDDIDRA